MKKERKKQIFLIVLSFMLMAIGYLNLNKNLTIEVASRNVENEMSLGDVQLVNSEPANEIVENVYSTGTVSNSEISGKIVDNSELKNEINKSFAQEERDKYFTDTKIERNNMYSETIETYQKMLENKEVSETQKVIAAQEIGNITNIKNGTMIAENLIKNKGFEDVVILVNNGIVSVIVKSSLLNQEQVAKIQNIVSYIVHLKLIFLPFTLFTIFFYFSFLCI